MSPAPSAERHVARRLRPPRHFEAVDASPGADRAPWRAMLVVALALAVLLAPRAGAAPAVGAQPGAESPEEAAGGLLPYLLSDAEVPAGYAFSFTRAYDNAAQTLDSLTTVPPDPRQPAEILAVLESAGRVLRLVQGIDADDPDSAAGLRAGVVLFRDADAATRALETPSVVAIVSPLDRVMPIDAPEPALGEGSAAYRIDYRDEDGGFGDRANLIVWRQGRVLFTTSAFGPADQADVALPAALDLARTYQSRVAALPAPPDSFGPPPATMPNAQARIDRYLQLRDRLLPEDVAGPNFKLFDTFAVNNAILVMDARDAAPPLNDPTVVIERVVNRQHRVAGVVRWLETVPEAADPPDSRYPELVFGYHLYADVAGATEALKAPVEEIALRLYQEANFGKPRDLQLADVPLSALQVGNMSVPLTIGDQSRVFGATYATTDTGTPIALVSVRWRRGPVELFVNASAPPTLNMTALMAQLVQQLDAAYTANPLPGV